MLGSSIVQNLSEKLNDSAPAHAKPRCTLAGPLPHKPLNWTVPALALIALAITVAYSATLFNWFAGDDFVHLIWLKDAIHNPELILRNFHANWLDVKTTKFYRPLISVFMVQDYALWGTNGFGFHLTNVLFLIFSSLTLFFIVRDLVAPIQGSRKNTPAFLAALIFGLYPLHLEPVSWITGRVDCIVTAFFLASLWCYMRWRVSKSIWLFAATWTSMVLGLLSKEMAIVLPATFVAYELLAAKSPADAATKTFPIVNYRSVRQTFAYDCEEHRSLSGHSSRLFHSQEAGARNLRRWIRRRCLVRSRSTSAAYDLASQLEHVICARQSRFDLQREHLSGHLETEPGIVRGADHGKLYQGLFAEKPLLLFTRLVRYLPCAGLQALFHIR